MPAAGDQAEPARAALAQVQAVQVLAGADLVGEAQAGVEAEADLDS